MNMNVQSYIISIIAEDHVHIDNNLVSADLPTEEELIEEILPTLKLSYNRRK